MTLILSCLPGYLSLNHQQCQLTQWMKHDSGRVGCAHVVQWIFYRQCSFSRPRVRKVSQELPNLRNGDGKAVKYFTTRREIVSVSLNGDRYLQCFRKKRTPKRAFRQLSGWSGQRPNLGREIPPHYVLLTSPPVQPPPSSSDPRVCLPRRRRKGSERGGAFLLFSTNHWMDTHECMRVRNES